MKEVHPTKDTSEYLSLNFLKLFHWLILQKVQQYVTDVSEYFALKL